MAGLSWVRRLIYFPDSAMPPVETVLPGAEDVTFATEDGLELHGWFLPAADPIATVVVFHGNGGNRADRTDIAAGLAERRIQVLLAEYRGYGENPGAPTEDGLRADARAALRYLASRPDVDAGRIVLFGESLGSGVAVGLAVESPPAAMILRSPFTSFAEIARMHYPMLPAKSLLPDTFDSLARIGDVEVPLLVIAGSHDSIVPPESSRRLMEAANEPKEYVEFAGADHNDWVLAEGPRMLDEVAAFVERHVGSPSATEDAGSGG
jgi:fermentation-respiration switch protein FrsA (DUF1100 family)